MDTKEAGSRGGKARWKGKTKKEKKAHAQIMVQARKSTKKK